MKAFNIISIALGSDLHLNLTSIINKPPAGCATRVNI